MKVCKECKKEYETTYQASFCARRDIARPGPTVAEAIVYESGADPRGFSPPDEDDPPPEVHPDYPGEDEEIRDDAR